MKKHHRLILTAGVALLLAILAFVIALQRQQLRRHRVFREPGPSAEPPRAIPPVEQWTATFSALAPGDLADLLARIEREQKPHYTTWSLGYLHARALIEDNEPEAAAVRLRPFLSDGHPFRSLALYHQAEIEVALGNEEAASRLRQELINASADAPYRQESIEEEAAYLLSVPDPARLEQFADRLTPGLETRERRDLRALLVEALMRAGQTARAVSMALSILEGGTTDDAADRASRAIDRPQIVGSLTAEQLSLLGETFQSHRHYDRAVEVLTAALRAQPARADELRFGIGRSYFGDEQYAEAQRIYVSGANATAGMRWKATFLFHASRAAQLQGDDTAGERLMTAAIAVKGTFPATTAALTQRIRMRAKQKKFAEAAADLALLRKIAPRERAILEGSLALALGYLGAGERAAAIRLLDSVPSQLLDSYDRAEFAYWRGRALEPSDLRAASNAYLAVLRSDAQSHFAYFARQRLDAPGTAAKLGHELQVREAEVTRLIAAQDFSTAKRLQSDRILLSSLDRPAQLNRLAAIYRELPEYRNVLELSPEPLPQFPVGESDRATLLMAMSLYDEATQEVGRRWALRPPKAALTRALALYRANASRESIYAVEVLMQSVPDDYIPDLLPPLVRQLLYPRYFYNAIARDSERFGADPRLVLSIMREESRFNPRAKSAAAARGLLQFIITTARDIGRNIGLLDVDAEDLYDPRVIISLGAKYVATLTEEFEGNLYKAVAAYNAGPNQVKLWTRLAPAPGDDYFLSSINFDETKHYVRKVMNSYQNY